MEEYFFSILQPLARKKILKVHVCNPMTCEIKVGDCKVGVRLASLSPTCDPVTKKINS